MKKKVLALVCSLAMVFACVLLVGCGGSSGGNADVSNSKYVGTWVGKSASFMGEEADMAEVSEGGFTLVLNADGTASFSSGEDESVGNWSETGKGVKVKGDDINFEFKDKDGDLEASVIGLHLLFEKQ
ncbi:MAG: hypothetical protein J6D34_01690 [Atopobiaceae bacterium]|nr:hypothetical protein [Atopobiaceae bacterium]